MNDAILHRSSKIWELDNIVINHNTVDYQTYGVSSFKDSSEQVRLHIGLRGKYAFRVAQLDRYFELGGYHNNILFTKGFDLEVENKSMRNVTLGINFQPDTFIHLAQKGNEVLKKFGEKVHHRKNALLAKTWKTNNYKIHRVVHEIIYCPYEGPLQQLFLFSKCMELLVLQADLYAKEDVSVVLSGKDEAKLLDAKEILASQTDNPPTIVELARQVALNEFKLKKGFKARFGTTLFGYVHFLRMDKAKRLLFDSQYSIKEIAYQTGYSSPQYFSKAFKQEFGAAPNVVRKNPDFIR